MASTGTIVFPSNSYNCPYSVGSTDYYYNFPGCSPTIFVVPNSFPCLSFVTGTSTCAVCYPGYIVVDGSCVFFPCGTR